MVAIRSFAVMAFIAAAYAQQPSMKAKKRDIDFRRRDHMARRVRRDLAAQLSFAEEFANACPQPETACPAGAGFECLDLSQAIDACGACGWSCEVAHPNAKTVSCADSACVIHACKTGYSFDAEAATCV